jgi:type II secretory pathway component PulF
LAPNSENDNLESIKMADFRYSGTSAGGDKNSGVISAPDRKAAIRILQQKGIVPIKVTENSTVVGKTTVKTRIGNDKGTNKKFSLPRFTSRNADNSKVVGTHEYGLKFARRLLELHSGGMPLGDSIFLLSQRLSERKLKAITGEVWHQLREGKSFAKATESIPHLFPAAMFPLFEAGEASGDMIAILKNTVEYIEERKALKKRILASLSYPFVLMFMVIIIMIGFLYYLVPKIQMMVESMGGQMNIFTRLLVGFSQWLISASPILVILGILVVVALGQWRRTERGRLLFDKWMLRVPLLGSIIEISGLYQLSNLMCTLMESGINTSDNLRLCERTIQNRWIRSRFLTARTMIIEGASFSVAFKQNKLYPESSIDILTVGENTGHLERGLREITNSIRILLDEKLKMLTVLVSAGAMTFAFLMVAFAAVGMVLSVLEVSQTINLQ